MVLYSTYTYIYNTYKRGAFSNSNNLEGVVEIDPKKMELNNLIFFTPLIPIAPQ